MTKADIVDVSCLFYRRLESPKWLTSLQLIVETIMLKRDMLKEYFLFEITASGDILSLPLLLKGYTPSLDKLPLFLMRLGPQVGPFTMSTLSRKLTYSSI